MYIILVFSIIVILIVNYYIFDRELLCPPVAILGLFSICALFGLLEYKKFAYSEFGIEATLMILLGLISFTISSLIPFYMEKVSLKNYIWYRGNTCASVLQKRIDIKPIYSYSFLIFGIYHVVIYYRFIVRTTGFSNFALAVQQFRRLTSVLNVDVPRFVSIGSRPLELIGLVSMFCLLYNIRLDKFRKTDFPLLLIVITWTAKNFITSARGRILSTIGSAIYLSYFFFILSGRRPTKINRNFLFGGILCFVAILVLFPVSAVILGRYQAFSQMNMLDYLSAYISFGIRNFDLYLKNPPNTALKVPGQETFSGIYRSLYVLFGIGEDIKKPLEFRSINGLNTGNVFTSFRRYHRDFGVGGIIILSGIQGLIFTWGYLRNKKKIKRGNVSFSVLLYSYFVGDLFFMPIEEYLFLNFSMSLPLRLVVLYILYELFIAKKISIVIRRY